MFQLILYIFVKHSLFTLPSIFLHGFLNEYNKLTITFTKPTELHNKNVMAFVFGTNGYKADFQPLIDNLMYLSKEISEEELLENDLLEEQYVIKLKNGELWVLRLTDIVPTGYSSIDEDTDALEGELSIYHNCNIILVGASKGGLVSMRYASKYNDYRIKKVITISAPLNGTGVVEVLSEHSPLYVNLKYNSDVIQEIEKDRQGMNAEVYHVVPTYDNLIIPVSSARYFDTPKSHIYTYTGTWYGHLGILHNFAVAKSIIKWTGKGFIY